MAQRISLDDYNNSDYTKIALRELNEQMKTFKFKTSKQEEPESIDGSVVSDDVVVPTRYVKKPRVTAKRKKYSDEEEEDNYTRVLVERVERLQKSIAKKSNELDVAEIRLYQKTLDLSNSQVDLELATQELKAINTKLQEQVKKTGRYRLKFYCSVALNVALAYCMMF